MPNGATALLLSACCSATACRAAAGGVNNAPGLFRGRSWPVSQPVHDGDDRLDNWSRTSAAQSLQL
jgi:hypothetical protein